MSILQRNLFAPSTQPFGLDLGSTSLKAVQFGGKDSSRYLKNYNFIQLPDGAVVNGQIHDAEIVRDAIENLLYNAQPHPITTKQVVCSVPELQAYLRLISIPHMSEEDMRGAIRWEIEADIPLSIDEVYFDWQPIHLRREEHKTTVLVVAVAKAVIDSILEVLDDVGLEPVGLEIESIAQARSLLPLEKEKPSVIIVDVGSGRTGFLAIVEGVPVFTSSISVSADSITQAISKANGISEEEALKIKFADGIGSWEDRDPLFASVQPVADELIGYIEKTVSFSKSEYLPSGGFDSVILSGGGGVTKGLVPYMASKMKENIQLGDPWTNVEMARDLPEPDQENYLQYATAIGLGLKDVSFESFRQ